MSTKTLANPTTMSALAVTALLLAACAAPGGGVDGPIDDTGKGDVSGPTCETEPCDAAGAPPWGLNDVSVLFPATDEDVPRLLGSVNERDGERVVLLPEEVFEHLGTTATFLTETHNRTEHYERLVVTSFRLDPCVDGFDPHAPSCSRAIRLVLQPAWPVGDGFSVYDASVHAFYELTESEWARFLADYDALRTHDLSDAPLRVHPVLAEEGMASDFARGLNDLIVQYARAEALTRMTFMATGRSGNNWFWGAFDQQPDGSFALTMIPEVEQHEDGFFQPGRDSEVPPVARPAFPNDLLSHSTLDPLTDEQVVAGLTELYALENPQLTNSTTSACGSCHLANVTIDHVLDRRAMDELDVPERYVSAELDISAPALELNLGKNMHAFSYAGPYPTISQRAINESAEVVAYLRAWSSAGR